MRHVVAERHIARGKGGDEQAGLQPARSSATHQNLSGSTSATNRYTVSKKPPIRPIQFSALKSLNALHDEPEHAEDDDGQADIEQVPHGALLGFARSEPVNRSEEGK